MSTKALSKQSRLSHITLAKFIKQLLEGPATARELVEVSGLHLVTVYEFMRAMRKYEVAHISAWDSDAMGRDMIAVFSLGPGRDAKRRRMTRAQISKKYRTNKRLQIIEGHHRPL